MISGVLLPTWRRWFGPVLQASRFPFQSSLRDISRGSRASLPEAGI